MEHKKNFIFGGRIGAGVFGQSVSMSAAMQILAAKILGIDHLVLTAAQGQDPLVENIYKIAEDKVTDFLKRNNVVGQKIEDVLKAFLAEVRGDPKWQKNSKYR